MYYDAGQTETAEIADDPSSTEAKLSEATSFPIGGLYFSWPEKPDFSRPSKKISQSAKPRPVEQVCTPFSSENEGRLFRLAPMLVHATRRGFSSSFLTKASSRREPVLTTFNRFRHRMRCLRLSLSHGATSCARSFGLFGKLASLESVPRSQLILRNHFP